MENTFEQMMEHIVASIRNAGYEPYDQLYGYLKTGDDAYITRTGDARAMVKTLDHKQLERYISALATR